jgi:hypothetical protein
VIIPSFKKKGEKKSAIKNRLSQIEKRASFVYPVETLREFLDMAARQNHLFMHRKRTAEAKTAANVQVPAKSYQLGNE